jgi:hypothetical protein
MSITAAVISEENIVINVIIVDNIEQSEKDLGVTLVEYTTENPAGIGYTYDGTNFSAPIVEEE